MLSIVLAVLTSPVFADMNCSAQKVAQEQSANKGQISVNCQEQAVSGFAKKETKPSRVTVAIENSKNGTVKMIEIPNNQTLDSLTEKPSLENNKQVIDELKKKKIKVGSGNKIDLVQIHLKEETILFADSALKQSFVASSKAIQKQQSRMVASDGSNESAGGVGRAAKQTK